MNPDPANTTDTKPNYSKVNTKTKKADFIHSFVSSEIMKEVIPDPEQRELEALIVWKQLPEILKLARESHE
jgi:hypothetical protein